MYINQKELEELKATVMNSEDIHSEPLKQFLKDLPRMNEEVEKIKIKGDDKIKDDASWFLSTVCAVLAQRRSMVVDKKITKAAERLYQMASGLLFEVQLKGEYAGSSYKKEPSALGWSFIRDSTIRDALLDGKPQYVFLEASEMRARCVPTKDMEKFTVVPFEIPVVAGVVSKNIDTAVKEWLKEQDKVDCEKFLYDNEEFGKKWSEVNRIASESKFNRIVSGIVRRLYDEGNDVRIVGLGIGDASEIKRVLSVLRKKVDKEKYTSIVSSMEVVGVDKFNAMGGYSFRTIKELGIRNYKLVKCDMIEFIPDEEDANTLYLLSTNTRNNLDEDKRVLLDKNVVRNLKRGDFYIRDEYYPAVGKELETALEYATYPAVDACLRRALDNEAVALVIQYNPNHPDGGNVEFFSVYRDKPVYRIHFRSVRRNIDTIKADEQLLGCNVNIHVDPTEHMVTSVLSRK
jgi:hypothetical protein